MDVREPLQGCRGGVGDLSSGHDENVQEDTKSL